MTGRIVERLLITGIAGGQGRLVAKRVADEFDVSGVDRVPWEGHPNQIAVHTMDLRKKKFEDIFRRERPSAVVHLAFVRHFRADPMVSSFPGSIDDKGTTEQLEHIATLIPDEWLAPSAMGTPEQCVTAIRGQFDLGADGVILHGVAPVDLVPVLNAYSSQ